MFSTTYRVRDHDGSLLLETHDHAVAEAASAWGFRVTAETSGGRASV